MFDHLKARGYADEATAAIARAVLDLERTRGTFYALEGMRRPRPCDAEGVSLDEVAAAVLSLAWPCTRNNRPGGSRSIHEAFEELGGRYRHCDVYEAMHGLLKGHELKSGRVDWQRTDLPSRFDAAGRFALRPSPKCHKTRQPDNSWRLSSSPPTSRRSRTGTSESTHRRAARRRVRTVVAAHRGGEGHR